ncbi:putative lipoprotein [Pseudogulbenkiania sp. NH8B]|uniref:hypothetical protein n=1 Tax=Pseudogulbenkiania sp. (strain NH8B) TaxID=748280 RepID=UPI0002279C59|nr:hypothetical protein [Pseudogulbenkiania sp. NH8B]BAK77600.1 putative lipoprotein [Pseudogulbenkiania sp. NH8B]
MKSKQILITLPVLVLAGIMLTGCNSDAPSAREAQKAIESRFPCEHISIRDFERVNGIPQNDGSYLVQVKYTVRVSPTDEIKAYAKDGYAKELAEAQEKVAQAQAFKKEYDSKKDSWSAANPGKSDYDFWREFPDSYKAYDDYVHSPQSQGDEYLARLPSGAKAVMEQKMMQTCPSMPQRIMDQLYQRQDPVEQYAGDVDAPFQDTLSMIKTDNGWMAGQ